MKELIEIRNEEREREDGDERRKIEKKGEKKKQFEKGRGDDRK